MEVAPTLDAHSPRLFHSGLWINEDSFAHGSMIDEEFDLVIMHRLRPQTHFLRASLF
jgi:hypothetical protein